MIGEGEPRGASGHQSAARLMALRIMLATRQTLRTRRERSRSKPSLTSEHKMTTVILSRKLFTIIPSHCLLRSKDSISKMYWTLFCLISCMSSPSPRSGFHLLSRLSPFRLAAFKTVDLSPYLLCDVFLDRLLVFRFCILENDTSADITTPRSTQVAQRILTTCRNSGVKLRCLALCVPQTWSRRETPIQEYLGPILDEAVATEGVETTFALEAQCQAQHLISKYYRELRDCNELMVLDFGGHSLVLAPSS